MQVQGFFNDNYCENCQQEGHRTWACPFQAKSMVQVKCTICGESSHPTSDCPEKQAYMKKQQTDQIAMLLESQYSQFKEDVNVKKSQGGANFITDFARKQTLSIGFDPNYQMAQMKAEQQKGFSQGVNDKIKKKIPEEEVRTNELPKFDDD